MRDSILGTTALQRNGAIVERSVPQRVLRTSVCVWVYHRQLLFQSFCCRWVPAFQSNCERAQSEIGEQTGLFFGGLLGSFEVCTSQIYNRDVSVASCSFHMRRSNPNVTLVLIYRVSIATQLKVTVS